jgi:hypothetical protein
MNNKPLVKIHATRAAEVCSRFDLNSAARALLSEELGCREFLDSLVVNKHYLTGIDFIACSLPPREAIWWGCLCLQHVYGDALSTPEKSAGRAAVQWVLKPTEENRAAAKAPAEATGPGSVAGTLAEAVTLTGEKRPASETSPGFAESFGPAKAVSRAIKVVTTKVDPLKIVETQRLLLELGIGVAEGLFLPPDSEGRLPSPHSQQGPPLRIAGGAQAAPAPRQIVQKQNQGI